MQKRTAKKPTTRKSSGRVTPRVSIAEPSRESPSGLSLVKYQSWDNLERIVIDRARQSKCGFNEYINRYIRRVRDLMDRTYMMDVQQLVESRAPNESSVTDERIFAEPVSAVQAPELMHVKKEEDTVLSTEPSLKRGRGRPPKDSTSGTEKKITSYFVKEPDIQEDR